jgi:hypothetical protein
MYEREPVVVKEIGEEIDQRKKEGCDKRAQRADEGCDGGDQDQSSVCGEIASGMTRHSAPSKNV